MDAPLVRAYLGALRDIPPDGRSLDRVRYCLRTLQSPDVRYLVAAVLGPGARGIARVAAAVLRAAGARTAILGRSLADSVTDGGPIDDELLARAGTLAAASGYQLADDRPELGELARRDALVVLALTAFAEAGHRAALLLDEAVDGRDPAHAPAADLVVIGDVDDAGLDRAVGVVPEGRPVVAGRLVDRLRERLEAHLGERPLLLGGRDHRVEDRDDGLRVLIRDEAYVTVPAVEGIARSELSTGIAAALALGTMGIRMREDWVVTGIGSLRGAAVAR